LDDQERKPLSGYAMSKKITIPAAELPPVRIIGDPVLRKKAKAVVLDDALRRQAEVLTAAMFAFDGLGLAAPQVGVSQRLIALCVPHAKESSPRELTPGEAFLLSRMPVVLVNPEILDRSLETVSREEGCLSVPEIYAPVVRPVRVTVRGRLLDNTEFSLECGGLLGRALQHEVDHLDGILFVDHLEAEELGKIKSRLNRLKKAAAKTSYQRMATA
jgi:peptide deformylase